MNLTQVLHLPTSKYSLTMIPGCDSLQGPGIARIKTFGEEIES